MDYRFTRTLEEQGASFARSMARFQAGGGGAGTFFCNALFAVATIETALARDGLDAAAAARLRSQVATLIAPFDGEVRAYAQVVADEADIDAHDDVVLAAHCAHRSVLEYLLTEYADNPAAASIEREDVERFDAELRRKIGERGPLPSSDVPAGIPASHWWWRSGGPAA